MELIKGSIECAPFFNRYLTAKVTLTISDGKVQSGRTVVSGREINNSPEEGPLSIFMIWSTATLKVKLTGDYMNLISGANVILVCKDANFTGHSIDEGGTFVFEDVVPKTGEECKLSISEVG